MESTNLTSSITIWEYNVLLKILLLLLRMKTMLLLLALITETNLKTFYTTLILYINTTRMNTCENICETYRYIIIINIFLLHNLWL
jgi:hypothetical protein